MRSLVRVVVGMFLVVGVGAVGVVGCQSGKGEHCQVPSDCESGYVCTTLGFCDTTNTDDTPDAHPSDAREDAAATTADADLTTPDAPPATIDASADAPVLAPDAQ
jgi:hypothetical protein